jgi:asparagine synthase (glutamine-hydrolysing)
MSGIYGVFKENAEDIINDNNIKEMAKWNKAYGSYGDSLTRGKIALGAFIEKLNDTLPKDAPIIEDEKTCAVLDAVLYNRDDLYHKLGIESKQILSDVRLLYLYIDKFGFKALEAVNGDFAGAFYDKEQETLTLFRDHMGVRPLFYSLSDDFVAFSTDIRGVIANQEVDSSIREDWIYNTAIGANNFDLLSTEYKNVVCVKPGSYMQISFSGKKIERVEITYWMLGEKKIKLSSDKAYQKRLRELIEDSVKRRLDAVSGTVGAELSGGLDSGIIDILINRFGRDCIYYSWSDSPEELALVDNDERLIIQDICKQENIECNYGGEGPESDSNVYKNCLETGIEMKSSEPEVLRYAMPPYINTLTITQTSEFFSSKGVKVVFTGHGGDEGVSHRANPYEMFHYHEYYHYFRYMFSTTHGMKNRIFKTLKKCKYNLTVVRDAFEKPFLSSLGAEKLLNKHFSDSCQKENASKLYFAYDPINYIKQGGSRNRLDVVALLGAYSNVRYMIPYLDYRVIDFAVSIPRYQYLRGRKDRYIFREAFKDLMPDSMYRLRTKEDFSRSSQGLEPNWFTEFQKDKEEIIDMLDRKMWDKYLDFQEIDRFKHRGEPVGDDIFRESNMYNCLDMYATAQKLIEKTRCCKSKT